MIDASLMQVCKLATSTGSSKQSAPALLRDGWRLCIALFAALSLVLLISASATHLHASALAADDCALCSGVPGTLADAPPAPAVVPALALQAYFVVHRAPPAASYISPKLLPHSCGPPQRVC
jgi:hypothetical protein